MNEKKPVSNVCYQIAAKNGRVLEVADFNTASGAAVQLWDNVKEDSQIWLLVEVAEGLYKLENKLTGKVLDVINAGSQNGAMAAPVGLYRQGQPALDAGAGGGRPLEGALQAVWPGAGYRGHEPGKRRAPADMG